MKKVLAALLVLALVAPAFAVSFTGTDLGGGKMRISFDVPTGEVLRGVALSVSTTAGTANIAGTGSVTAINSFFDVFIDYAFSWPTGFTVTPRIGHPVANPAAAGELTVFPASAFSLSMGVLDETGNQGGVTGSGVLCEIQYAITGASATIHVAADTLRGGAVVGDAVTQPTAFDTVLANGFTLTTSVGTPAGTVTVPGMGAFPNLTGPQTITAVADPGYGFVNWTGTGVTAGKVANPALASTTITMDADYTAIANFAIETISTPSVAKTTAAPAIEGAVNSGRSETFVASGAVSSLGHALEYQFTWGDTTSTGWVTASQAKTYTYGGVGVVKTTPYVYNVTVQARCATHNTIMSAPSAIRAESSEAVKSTSTIYATWATFSRPVCWAYQRNCRGDGNGIGTGIGVNKVWVNSADLTLLGSGYNKIQTALLLITNGICGDNNRLGTGIGANKVWVNSADLTILGGYYNKTQASVPVCDQTNYHYWTN